MQRAQITRIIIAYKLCGKIISNLFLITLLIIFLRLLIIFTTKGLVFGETILYPPQNNLTEEHIFILTQNARNTQKFISRRDRRGRRNAFCYGYACHPDGTYERSKVCLCEIPSTCIANLCVTLRPLREIKISVDSVDSVCDFTMQMADARTVRPYRSPDTLCGL